MSKYKYKIIPDSSGTKLIIKADDHANIYYSMCSVNGINSHFQKTTKKKIIEWLKDMQCFNSFHDLRYIEIIEKLKHSKVYSICDLEEYNEKIN